MAQLNLEQVFKTYMEKRPVFKNKDILTDRHIPNNIPHREEQINQIAKTLAPALASEKISNMFLFGTVGTGKSVSVRYVATELEKKSENIRILYINCKMKKVSDTEYRLLAELIRRMGQTVPATGLPTDRVYRIFFGLLDSKKQNVILILDEIDALVKKMGDDILYNLTRANQDLKNTKLSIIGISNDLSFTDHLDPRVKSSLSEEEIIFPPYNANQLQDILVQRAGSAFNDGVLEQGVIAKCAALAAQEHGDARKALDLLRVAGELVERQGDKKITTKHVDKAEERLDTDRITTVISTQPKQSQAVLASIIKLVEEGQKNIQTGDVFSVYEDICSNRGLKVLTQRRVSDLIAELDMLGIINARVISRGRYGRTKEIRIQLGKPILKKTKKILEDSYLLAG
jgi:cell division control protein 6